MSPHFASANSPYIIFAIKPIELDPVPGRESLGEGGLLVGRSSEPSKVELAR
jgi:hypothetical protein